MGWTCTEKPNDIRQHLLSNVTFETDSERHRALDIAIVHLRTAYIAVETTVIATRQTYVCAAVVLMNFYPKDLYGFCTKWLDESMGPVESECPERILELLTPTPHDNHWSRAWRQRCWDNITVRKEQAARIASWDKGQMLVYSDDNGRGLIFGGELEVRDFRVLDKRRNLFTSPGYSYRFRIPRRLWRNLQEAPATEPRVAA